MTTYLADLASYQEGIDLAKLKSAGFTKVNIKLSEGTSYTWSNAGKYINQAKELGLGISTFHWLNNSASGGAQAKIVLDLMKKYGVLTGTAHQCDCEDNVKPATWQIWKDYVTAIQDGIQHHVVNYTGDWWWQAAGRNWNGAVVTPYLWAAPNHGYDKSYPGDTSSDWIANYGGWGPYSILQYAVGQVYDGNGADQVSKSAIKDESVWAALTGGSDVTLAEDFDGKYLYPRVEALALLQPPGEGPEMGQKLPGVEAIKRMDTGIISLQTQLSELKTAVSNITSGPISLTDAQITQLATQLAPLLPDVTSDDLETAFRNVLRSV